MSAGRSPSISTRANTAIVTIADIEAIERQPYETLIPARNLYDLLVATAELHPERLALTVLSDGDPDKAVTYTHLAFRCEVARAANMFRSLLGAGSDAGTVAFLCTILPQIPAALLGAQVAGVASSINYLLSEDATADLLAAVNAAVLVVPSEAEHPELWKKANAVIARLPSIRTVLVAGGGESCGQHRSLTAELAKQSDALAFAPSVDPAAVCALFHTGGTTGRPKLVRLTHGNQIHAAWSFAQVHGLDELDVTINGFPLFHVGGTVTTGLSVLSAGGHVVIPSAYSLRSRNAVRNYWDIVAATKATIVSGVPTSIAALTEVPIGDVDIKSVRMGLTGGAVCPKAVSDRFTLRTGITLYETYGMTETAAAIAFNPGRAQPQQGSVGFRAPFATTRIIGIEDQARMSDCPALTSGLVIVRGPQVFPGYVDPRHNQGVLTDDGWLITGDIGYLTVDQRLVLTGREKDLIVRSGHNIDPAAIEDVANEFPGVQMSSAVGMPDAYAGEVPILFVVPSPDATIDLDGLRTHIDETINEPPAKPKQIVILDALPVTAVGKIFKPALRELAIQERVRMEIAALFVKQTHHLIEVGKDDKLNTVVRVMIDSDDTASLLKLTDNLSALPQTFIVERTRR